MAVSLTAPASAAPDDEPRVTIEKAPEPQPLTEEAKEAPEGDKLGQNDLQLLADARREGTKRVTVMLATDRKATAGVVAELERAGAWVGRVEDKLGYVRASVPTGSVEKIAGLSRVEAVDLDQTVPIDDPQPGKASGAGSSPSAAPGPRTPDANPYMPTREIGSVDFKKRNKAYDGRGVTIGIVDSGVDLDHPALAETTTGETKISDWVTATDPVLDGDLTWRPMVTDVSGPSFSYQGRTWQAPGDGAYKVSLFSESVTEGGEPEGDVNRDGDTDDRFGILYDEDSNDIWVDADQDGTFADDELMRPYAEDQQVGFFGTDDPSTEIVERTPFVVEYREDVSLAPYGLPGTADFVNIGLTADAHGTHVAGIAAANSMFGGAMDGQAPGAKIVSSRACVFAGGCTAAALTDGMIDVVTKRGVDVVNMSIGGLPALNDANNARAVLYDRLIADYGVQMFISAGNSGPGLNTIGDPSVASTVVSVASSISKETWKANYGSIVARAMDLHPFSSRGPSESGDFKPNIAAPGSAVSTVPRWYKQADLAEAGYELPIGYAMFNGTSMASPQATGAAALLLSGAFDREIPVTPKRLRDAIYTSAEPIDGVSVAGQGAGLFDVEGAWKLLSKKKQDDVAEYTTDAPVCTPLSGFLARPGRGTGVHNRCAADAGGHTVRKGKTYDVEITRTTGEARATNHRVRIVGNDGTFKAPKTVRLAKGRTTTVPVTATTRAQGASSAILEIDDPRTSVVDHRVMLTVVQSTSLGDPDFSSVARDEVQRNNTRSYFVTVPEGAKALQVNLSDIATRSQTRFIAINPYGVPSETTASTACYTNYSSTSGCNPVSRSYADPLPGVWEIEVEARRTSPILDNPFSLTASVQGVTVDPAEQTLDSVAPGETAELAWTVENDFGTVDIEPTGGPLGSAVEARRSISDGASEEFEVDVPEGATTFTAQIGSPSDPSADLDLVVVGPDGAVVGESLTGGSEEVVTLDAPAAGTYTVIVDAYAIPAGSTEYDYLDVFYSPGLGSLEVSGGTGTLERGESVEVTGTLTAQEAPAEGRTLFGRMQVVSAEGALLGAGTVSVAAVAVAEAVQPEAEQPEPEQPEEEAGEAPQQPREERTQPQPLEADEG